MKKIFLSHKSLYDGSQLASLFAYQTQGILGDSIVSWVGPCNVTVHMVDAEDQRAGERICGSEMLHFVVEVFHQPLSFGVAWQRLMSSLMIDTLQGLSPQLRLTREGDDIYFFESQDRRKLSISIATVSPISVLIHFAVNVTNHGTPVATAALEEWSLDPAQVAEDFMTRVTQEFNTLKEATCKVHGVGSFQSEHISK